MLPLGKTISRKAKGLARALLACALTLGTFVPLQFLPPTYAYAETTGMKSPVIVISYGTGDTIAGTWREDTLTIDGSPAYCVEVDSHFQNEMQVTSCDPVARGIWSQEICTKLALIDHFVKSGSYVSTSRGTGNGHKVTNPDEQYAVAQCYIWKFLNDAGYATNHHGWFGACTASGIDLTGSDTDSQIWDYVGANIGSYIGSARYFDCGSAQDLACSFSLEPATGYITLTKKSADESLVSGNAEYSLTGAEYGIYTSESCSDKNPVGKMTTNSKGEAKSKALPHGDYFVKETTASPGFQKDATVYPVTVKPGEEQQVNVKKGYVPEKPETGSVALKKASASKTISSGNSAYSLSGAVYGIYSDAKCKDLVAKMTTDESGSTQTDGLALGKRYVREISAPKGYAINSSVYEIVISPSKTATVNGGSVSDLPKNNPVEILLRKADAQLDNAEEGSAQGSASLANAEFEVSFYSGFFDTDAKAEKSGEPQRTWTFKTDEKGSIKLDESHLVSGDALYKDSKGAACLPLGTLVIKETVPPEGYLLNEEPICVKIEDDGKPLERVESFSTQIVNDQVKRGDFEFVKYSDDTENTLAGIPFSVTSKTTGETHVIVTDENGIASTHSEGKPHTRNTNGNDWALEKDLTSPEESKEDAEETIKPDASDADQGATNEPETALTTQEQEEEPGASPAEKNATVEEETNDQESSQDDADSASDNSPRKTESSENEKDSGEKASEDAGENSASNANENNEDEKAAESQDELTPASEEASDPETAPDAEDEKAEDPAEKESETDNAGDSKDQEQGERFSSVSGFDLDAGIWFGKGTDGSTPLPDDTLGALPYDTYEIKEIPCPENEGLQLVSASVIISEDGVIVDLGPINDPKAMIATTARDAQDDDKAISCSDDAKIIDTVSYANLIPEREYTLTATLINAADGSEMHDENGNVLSGSSTFTASEESGEQEVVIGLSTMELEGTTIVVFEKLECDGRVIASHEEIADQAQTVRVPCPEIGTSASDEKGKSQIIGASTQTVVMDAVSYSGATPGKTYTVEGTLINAHTKDPFVVEGDTVTASETFTAAEESGTVEVTFEFDSTEIEKDTDLVAFEKLFTGSRLVASHEDPDDPAQTVKIVVPEIGTSLENKNYGGKIAQSCSPIELCDTVSYSNLTVGREYQVNGILMDKATGEPFADEQGNPIESSITFTAESEQGTIEIPFSFKALLSSNANVVAFETLFEGEKEIAQHKDLEDAAQTVTISAPTIHTSAVDAADQDKIVEGNASVKVIDTVSISNVEPNHDYILVGLMMDKSTNLPMIQGISEKEAAISDARAVAASSLTEFWTKLLTTAQVTQNESGGIELSNSQEGSVSDKAAANAIMGEYPEIANRISIESKTVRFENGSGTAEVPFAFSSHGIAGQTVAFEALIDPSNNRIIAIHADMNDEDQTIEIVPPAPEYPPSESKAICGMQGSAYDKTGYLLSRYAWAAALVAATGCVAGVIALSKRTKRWR